MIASRARFRHAKKIERLAGDRFPEFAFSPVMLETITTRFNFDALDFAIREQLLAFDRFSPVQVQELAAVRLP